MNRLVEGKGPEGRGTHSPLGKAHAGGTGHLVVAVIVSHVAVEKVIVIPAHHSRVSPNSVEAALNVMWGVRVKSTVYVQKSSEAMRAGVDMTFYVIRKGRGGILCGFVAAKAVLLRVYWIESDTLLHMP